MVTTGILSVLPTVVVDDGSGVIFGGLHNFYRKPRQTKVKTKTKKET